MSEIEQFFLKAPLSGLRQFLTIDYFWQFYFMIKTLLVQKIFTFWSWHFGYLEKLKLISTFLTSQTGQEIIKIHLCSCYHTVPSTIREIFFQFLIFWNLFHDFPLEEWNMRNDENISQYCTRQRAINTS